MNLKFKREVTEFDGFKPVDRRCPSCNQQNTFYRDNADESILGCLECDQCHEIVWYWGGEPLLVKYFGEKKEGIYEIEKRLEKRQDFVSPCPSCGGHYKHIEHRVYGFPRYCPKCGASQMNEAVKFERATSLARRIQVNYIEFYEGEEGEQKEESAGNETQ